MKKLKFHERFSIQTNTNVEKARFVQAIKTIVMTDKFTIWSDNYDPEEFPYDRVKSELAIEFGKIYNSALTITVYIPDDFLSSLRAVEVIYENLDYDQQEILSKEIYKLLENAKTDLGVRYKEGLFYPEGSELLDQSLVNDVLNCMSSEEHNTILKSFVDGLNRYLESMKDKSKLKDAIDNMYEALEAFARYINDNDKDLSANRELLISNLKLNDYYKKMLGDYIEYANAFRHAEGKRKPRPQLKRYEVEAFIYMTGLFIRLGMKSV